MLKLDLIGRLGRDAELKTLDGGGKVVNFAVATDVGHGENMRAQWSDCALYGSRAEKLAPFLTKGREVFVTGTGAPRIIDGRNGQSVILDVKVFDVQLVGAKPQSDPAGYQTNDDAPAV